MRLPLTELRKKILGLIERSETPVSAKAIRDRIPNQRTAANLSTVYRALDYLVRSGLIQSVSLYPGAQLYLSKRDHRHFLVCRGCREIRSFSECAAAAIQARVEKEFGYVVQNHVLYFTGLCPACGQSLKKKSVRVPS